MEEKTWTHLLQNSQLPQEIKDACRTNQNQAMVRQWAIEQLANETLGTLTGREIHSLAFQQLCHELATIYPKFPALPVLERGTVFYRKE